MNSQIEMRCLMLRWLLALISFFILAGCAGSPPKKAPQPQEPPLIQDHGKELGKSFMKTALKKYTFVKDPEVTALINEVGREIVEAIGEDPDTYHFFVVRQNQLNAFAIPGGYIFLFDGLLKNFDSIDALAGVLGHEIAHVRLNHFFKDAKKISAINLATMASLILAGLAGEGMGATGTIAIAANASMQLGFSRKNEEEADLHAIRFLSKTRYNPAGLSTFFSTLSFYQRLTQGTVPPYLSTHPGVGERRFMVDRLVRNLPKKTVPEAKWDRVATILRAKKGGSIKKRPIKKGEEQKGQERRFYMRGLAALKSGALNEALEAYQEAIRLAPDRAIYYADLSNIYMQLQQANLAKSAALRSIQLSEQSMAQQDIAQDIAMPYLVLGMIAQSEKNHENAVSQLEKAKDRAPENSIIHFQLARSYHALGKRGKERFYLGRYHRLNLEPEKALQEFKKALDLVDLGSLLEQTIQTEIRGIQTEGV